MTQPLNSTSIRFYVLLLGIIFSSFAQKPVFAQSPAISTITKKAWANNAVNTVIFRKNAVISHKGQQYAAFYDESQNVVLAKRKLDSKQWITHKTQFKGDATDAHKSISIAIDGAGFLHLAWGQHNNKLNYSRSLSPGGLKMGDKQAMLGLKEDKVSYPEFYKLASGDVLFMYRDGGSGNGNLMINRYVLSQQKWIRVQDGLIDGAQKRNAYWQTAVDAKDNIYLSWVWRESPDVASNHDLCFAKSTDGGKTWQKSTEENYQLPINAENAEYACKIPQNSELINQTAMYAAADGAVYIATYWRDADSKVPQYHVVYRDSMGWKCNNLNFRKTPFSLSGGGTKKIPISRPQIVAIKNKQRLALVLIFRDSERANRVSLAICKNLAANQWQITDLTSASVGDWEPNYDIALWQKEQKLSLFLQNVVQIDGEGKANIAGSAVQILTYKPNF